MESHSGWLAMLSQCSFARRALLLATSMILGSLLVSCGADDSGPSGPQVPVDPNADVLTLKVNDAAPVAYTEASGLPDIDCDPRVDWSAYQVILWDDYTDGAGPSGYERFLDLMFPVDDSVGTYTVHGESMQAYFYDGVDYSASPILASSTGTVTVTRSDTRIEGTFDLTLVDASETSSVQLAGFFSVDRGFSLSCP